MTKNHLNFYFTLISFITYFLFLPYKTFSIGYIESITGNTFLVNNNENIELLELDEISLNDRIKVSDNSQITILLDDGSTLIIKNKSEFVFLEYEDIFSINPHYKIEVLEGEILIETGEIPKFKKNSTSILTPIGSLFLNGTAISANLKGEETEIFLMTDSFGESGELVLQNNDGESLNIEINSGLTINDEGTKPIKLTQEVINNQNTIKKVIANSAISNNSKIDEISQKKINSGKLTPQQAESFKEKILKKKEKKIDQIITSSKSDTSILGEMLISAEGDIGSKILEKVVEKNPGVTSKVLNDVIDQNEELFKQISVNNEILTEKILKTVVSEADEDDQSLSKIIAKTDSNISAKLITEIAENKKDLMIKVVSETTSLDPEKMKDIAIFDQEINNKISEVIVEQISSSIDATEDLKQIMLNIDSNLTSNIIEQTSEIDISLVSQATSEVLEEETEKIIEKLSSSLDEDEDNFFNSVIISKAIESGNTNIVTRAVEINIQNNLNNLNSQNDIENNSNTNTLINESQNSEQNLQEQGSENLDETKEIELAKNNILKVNSLINKEVEKLKIDNPSLIIEDKLFISVNEVLASPN